MKIESLKELWVHEMKDLYSAETQIVEALPKIIAAASHEELKAALTEHLAETKGHIARLERIFKGLNFPHNGHHCKGMEGLLEEGQGILEVDAEPVVRDAAIISASQRVEHYEIAGYGTASAYAELLGENESAALLQLTLDEESSADTKLSRLARTRINLEAMAADQS
ncbi:MAG TPA: ferritin-like domain-containing protein [Thermoanaerobaculia bacterium]|nr:ferritin-like domain-containing protein [Thermoanaerobaculia bacterium]